MQHAPSSAPRAPRRLLTGMDARYPRRGDKQAAALLLASWLGDVQRVESLLLTRMPLEIRNTMGCTPLHSVAQRGHVECGHLLIKAKANLDAVDRSGRTPLHHAVAAKQAWAVKLLLANGADANLKDVSGSRAVDLAHEHYDGDRLLAWKTVGREQSLSESLAVLDAAAHPDGIARIKGEVAVMVERLHRERIRVQSEAVAASAVLQRRSDETETHAAREAAMLLQQAMSTGNADAIAEVLERRRAVLAAAADGAREQTGDGLHGSGSG